MNFEAPQAARHWQAWLPCILALTVTLTLHAAILSDGFAISLFEPDGPSQYFDASADALLEGRLDVDPYHVGNEAFLIGAQTYGYYGLLPALLRMPLHVLFPALWGHWQRVMLLLAAAATVLGAQLLVLATAVAPAARPRRRLLLHSVYLLLIGVGSTTLFLPSRPNIYHEAIAWGSASALLGFGVLARWLQRPSLLSAALAVTLCCAALHARMPVGFGLALSLLLVAVAGARRRHAGSSTPQRLVLALGAVLACGSYTAVNAAKFGSLLSLPYAQHLQTTPERLAKSAGKQMSFANVLPNAYNYLMPWNVRWSARGEPIRAVPPEALLATPGMEYDWREPIIGLAFASPLLLALSVLGIVALLRGRGERGYAALVIGSALSAAGFLLYHGITQRYAHDLLPLLAVTAAMALPPIEQRMAAGAARGWAAGLLLGSVWSLFVWCQVTLQYRDWGQDLRNSPVRADIIIPAYEHELQLHPDNALLRRELAQIDLRAGRFARADAQLTQALALDPKSESTLLQLAYVRQRSDKQAAITLLQSALISLPESAELHSMLAMLLFTTGRSQEALEQLRSALRVDPNDARLRELLARVEAGRAATF